MKLWCTRSQPRRAREMGLHTVSLQGINIDNVVILERIAMSMSEHTAGLNDLHLINFIWSG